VLRQRGRARGEECARARTCTTRVHYLLLPLAILCLMPEPPRLGCGASRRGTAHTMLLNSRNQARGIRICLRVVPELLWLGSEG